MRDLDRRLDRLETFMQSHEAVQKDGGEQSHELWAMQMEWTALHLVRGLAPGFTLDELGAFFTLDGRFALSAQRMDLQALMGPQTERMRESIPLERWREFLDADQEASELLERLQPRADSFAVPEDFEMPMEESHRHAELGEGLGDPDGVGGSVFLGAEEKEATRRLTYVLLHDAESLANLSALTRRRDAYVGEGGEGGSYAPLCPH